MGKIKEHYWDEIIDNQLNVNNDYEVFEALHYQSTLWNVVELMQKHSVQTVLMDVFKLLEKKEIDNG